MVSFTVLGNPVPKARPRVVAGRAYTERRTKDWERRVSIAALNATVEPLTGQLSVTLAFYRANHVRCDTDNLSKAVLDAMNGIVYVDDQQVVDLHIRRYVDADNPRVEVVVQEAMG